MPRIRGLLILCLVACGGEKDADTASTDTTRSTTTPSPTQSTADTGTPSTTPTTTTPTSTTSTVGTADTSVDPVISSMSFNEVLANPGGYDANCDGVGSTTEDEFIELVNTSAKPVILDGATLGDLITTHHVFPKGTTIEPGGAVVVFSGGLPAFDQPLPDRGAHCVPLPETALVQVASSGRLGLINGGETLLLTETKSLLSATYGGLDLSGESFNRDPDMALKGWTGHRSVMGSANGFSPGTRVDGSGFDGSPAYTEGDTGTTTTTTTTTDTAEDTGFFDTGKPVATIDLGAFLVNEIHADAVVDGNCDGVASFTEDEFIELVFQGSEGLDLEGVRLTNESSIRHTFEPLWVEPGDAILIFGGGSAGFGSDDHAWCGDLPDNVHVVFASSGSLALGDRGDEISLVDMTGTLSVDTSWDDTLPSDQSAVRSPELSDSPFVGHLTVSDSPVSPGTQSHGARLDEPAPAPDTGMEDTSSADTALEDTSSTDTALEDTGAVDTAPPAPAYDTATVATYSLVINEILADPDLEAGDANCDGEADVYDDEFVEIVNRGDITADLTGSTLSDAYGVRHTIGPVVLSPNEALVIFGGGDPKLDGGSSSEESHCMDVTFWATIETSSTGGLGLTNTDDELTLTHPSGLVLASAVYGEEAGMNQSIVRVPELSDASWVGHSSVVEAPFSPGARVNGTAFFAAPALDTGLPVETADTGEPDPALDTAETDTAAIDTGGAEPMSDIVLNELLATTELDSNCDGLVSEPDELFLEWVNRSDAVVSMGNWEIRVDGVTKHVFTGLSLNPGDAVIVFGGGVPLFDGSAPWSHCSPLPGDVTAITASTGGLDLSPSGSSVMLVNRTGVEMHSYTYGDEGSGETSLVRDPELSDEPMVPHTDLDARSSFSPGTRAGGGAF